MVNASARQAEGREFGSRLGAHVFFAYSKTFVSSRPCEDCAMWSSLGPPVLVKKIKELLSNPARGMRGWKKTGAGTWSAAAVRRGAESGRGWNSALRLTTPWVSNGGRATAHTLNHFCSGKTTRRCEKGVGILRDECLSANYKSQEKMAKSQNGQTHSRCGHHKSVSKYHRNKYLAVCAAQTHQETPPSVEYFS